MAGEKNAGNIYGEGFGAVYASTRYTVFSQRIAKHALGLIEELKPPGHRLLDLACGAGAGSLVFAKAGYDVSGIDQSAVMLRYASEHAAAQGVQLQLSEQDMRTFALDGPVDVVTCLFDSLNYVTDEEDLGSVFRSVGKALRLGGVFVFDMNTVEGLATRWGTQDQVFTNRANMFEVNQSRFDEASATNTTTTTLFIREPSTELFRRYTEVHRERAFPLEMVRNLLEQSGLAVAGLYGLRDGASGLQQSLEPWESGMGRVMVAARRI